MKSPGYQAPAVQRAFRVLKLVADSDHDLGITEIAKRLGFNKSTTHGLIQGLLKAGALEQSPYQKTFFLGPAVVDLALRSWNYLRIKEQSQPILDELRDRIGETVFLGVLTRSRGIIITTADSLKPLKISAPPGTTIPLLAGAVGKVFLAGLKPELAEEIIRQRGLRSFTSRSIVSEKQYLEELVKVREKGYALDDEEYMPGVRAVAVNLGNQRGLVLAIWVVGFSATMTDRNLPTVIKHTLWAAEKFKTVIDKSP
ncbi:MAG: IclR family transcriptional regulator [Deltaproteobacteria bacterium]|nr:IclR family transcriptional regulator [Deltaproteobacteria bacterium]MBW1960688.1 IclR family transcriptional regulator [Deltaproteobacteria bacterium]MBW2151953.1 IclR family transcriptional regulator [Deltaproteobacteria bacterium]